VVELVRRGYFERGEPGRPAAAELLLREVVVEDAVARDVVRELNPRIIRGAIAVEPLSADVLDEDVDLLIWVASVM
jgi:hypothetical protein